MEFFKLQEWGFGATDLTARERRELYTYVGTADCPYTGGFNNTFTYKAFELGVNFSFDFGGKVRSQPTYSIVDFDKGRNTNRDILNQLDSGKYGNDLPGSAESERTSGRIYVVFKSE